MTPTLDLPVRSPAWPRWLMWTLVALAAVNVLAFARTVANPMIMADN